MAEVKVLSLSRIIHGLPDQDLGLDPYSRRRPPG